MKTKRSTKALIIVASIMLIGGAVAFAHGGSGYGGHMMGNCSGYGDGQMMGKGSGCGGGRMMGYGPHMRGFSAGNGLSDEELSKLDAAREKFFSETRQLRGRMDEKQVALRNEMIKDDPDAGKVVELQKELSKLRGEFDQKAVAHQLEMRKLMPEKYRNRGYGRGYGGGYCSR